MKAFVIDVSTNSTVYHPGNCMPEMGHSQSHVELTLNKIYEVSYLNETFPFSNYYNLYKLIDDTGREVWVSSERFMLLSEYRDKQIEEILA